MYGNTKRKSSTGKFKRNDVIIILLMGICVILVMGRNMIFQEGNPLQYIGAMISLAAGRDYAEAERIGTDGNKEKVYVTKGEDHESLFGYIEENFQVKYKDQNGSGYVFEGTGGERILTGRKYFKYFTVWSMTGDGN